MAVTGADAPVRPRRVRVGVAVGLVLAALAFLVWRGLDEATLYFRDVDEVVDQRADLQDQRIRMRGVVVADSVAETDTGVEFEVEWAGATLPVHHVGDPPELFQEAIPVVLEGRLHGSTFDSDRILVKHTSEYQADHPDRLDGDPGTAPTVDE